MNVMRSIYSYFWSYSSCEYFRRMFLGISNSMWMILFRYDIKELLAASYSLELNSPTTYSCLGIFTLSLFRFIVIANCPSIEKTFVLISLMHYLNFYTCLVAYRYKSFFCEALSFEKDFLVFLKRKERFWMYYFALKILFYSYSIHLVSIRKMLVDFT